MRCHTRLTAAAIAVGLVATACGGSHNSSTATTTSTTSTTTSATTTSAPATATTTASANADLQRLIPTPVNTERTDGPDPMHDNGIRMHFLVNGAPTDVMSAYKTSLEGMSWSVALENSSNGGGGGGATYTGTNGNAYGVFTGGGYRGTTDVHACVWPAKPSNTDCERDRNR
jgi:hypothetical protein